MYLFTADEHYNHRRILEYSKRPFGSIQEMDAELIRRHNAVVGPEDTVIHAGDFTLAGPQFARRILEQLQGRHVFVRGSHDKWLRKAQSPVLFDPVHEILELVIEGQPVVVCHYAMRVWPKSHYGSWQLFGHSHGRLPPLGKQLDVGVDCHDFAPVSWHKVVEIMKTREDNPNLVKRPRRGSDVGLAAPRPAEEES